jgi:hypothetical protein
MLLKRILGDTCSGNMYIAKHSMILELVWCYNGLLISMEAKQKVNVPMLGGDPAWEQHVDMGDKQGQRYGT